MGSLKNEIEAAAPVLPEHELNAVMVIVDRRLTGQSDKQTVLQKADKLIHGERLRHYGHPSVNFQRIATAWSQFLGQILKPGKALEPSDVCMMMILLKVMRMAEGYHSDSVLDIAGYAALAAILEGEDEL